MYSRLRIPGILIECGFLSNANEKQKLINEEYQEKFSKILAEAFLK